jgi:hypothetical protein
LKELVRTVFECQFKFMQEYGVAGEAGQREYGSGSLDAALQELLGKKCPRPCTPGDGFFARFSRWPELRLLKERSRQDIYRVIFQHAVEEADLAVNSFDQTSVEEIIMRVRGTFTRNLLLLLGGDPEEFHCAKKQESIIDMFDRQIKAWLNWCISLLPYHAPALSDQDPSAILVRATSQ